MKNFIINKKSHPRVACIFKARRPDRDPHLRPKGPQEYTAKLQLFLKLPKDMAKNINIYQGNKKEEG